MVCAEAGCVGGIVEKNSTKVDCLICKSPCQVFKSIVVHDHTSTTAMIFIFHVSNSLASSKTISQLSASSRSIMGGSSSGA